MFLDLALVAAKGTMRPREVLGQVNARSLVRHLLGLQLRKADERMLELRVVDLVLVHFNPHDGIVHIYLGLRDFSHEQIEDILWADTLELVLEVKQGLLDMDHELYQLLVPVGCEVLCSIRHDFVNFEVAGKSMIL